ncbi:unnamed protein product [Polarella glacialis]|uniref:Uncharacterized protein n=1 Tax=Polarella glacialis TaxID=89957 RepID=A0A813L8B6_POLGL|nr:unnamed protein product [Polarella glacialis]
MFGNESIFCMPALDLDCGKYRPNCSQCYSTIYCLGAVLSFARYHQVVLTRIDRVEESIAKSSAGSSSADQELKLRQVLDKKIEDIVMKLDVSRTAVHFIENYHSGVGSAHEARNVSVDFHGLKILTQCCSHADAFVAQSLRGGQQRQPSCTIH